MVLMSVITCPHCGHAAIEWMQSGAPGGYVRTPGGFMVLAPNSPQGSSPYVANPPSYPYVRPPPGYPNINAPSLQQQYNRYGYPYPQPR